MKLKKLISPSKMSIKLNGWMREIMGDITKLLMAILLLGLCFIVWQGMKQQKQLFNKQNMLKSSRTMFSLAIGLLIFVYLLIQLANN